MDTYSRTVSVLAVVAMLTTSAIGGFVLLAGLPGPASAQPQPTVINGCQSINQPGTYVLARDLNVTGTPGGCIPIRASDVTLLGNGNTLDGGGQGVGIFVNPEGTQRLSDVRIENVEVRDWNVGVAVTQVDRARLQGLAISDAENFGVLFSQVSGSVVVGSTFTDNGYGILTTQAGNNLVLQNAFRDSDQAGVFLSSQSAFNQVSSNRFTDNQYGVQTLQASNNDVTGVFGGDNDFADVYLQQSTSNRVELVETAGSEVGVFLEDSNGNDVSAVRSVTTQLGIGLVDSDNNTVRNSAVVRSSVGVGTGDNSSDNTIRNVSAAYAEIGIFQGAGSNNSYVNNSVTYAEAVGILASRTADHTFEGNVVAFTGAQRTVPFAPTAPVVAGDLNGTDLPAAAGDGIAPAPGTDLQPGGIPELAGTGLSVNVTNVVGPTESGDGVRLSNATGITVTGNIVFRNDGDGVELDNADDNVITANTICENGGEPIAVDADSAGNTIANNDLDC